MPTTAALTFAHQKLEPFRDPQDARTRAVKPVAAVANLAKGTVMGQVTTGGLWKAYASGNVDGSQTPKGILVWDVQVDASGKVTFSATSGQSGGEFAETFNDFPIYVQGVFRTTDLVGLDATAVTNAEKWHLEAGTIADGVLMLG